MVNKKLIINIKRYFIEIENEVYERYALEELNSVELLFLLENQFLDIRIQFNEETNEKEFNVCLVKTLVFEDGDYNIEDEYIPFTDTTYVYQKINFNPITGEGFQFIVEDIDYTDDYKKLLERYNSLKGHLTVDNFKEQGVLQSIFDSFNENSTHIELKCCKSNL